jgi:putative lipoic acid-binding regulatory protein
MEPERIIFPAEYPIKVIARAHGELRPRLDAVFSRHFGAFEPERVSERPSAQNAFTALTYRMTVEAEQQLVALHEELKAVDGVIMVL